MGRLIDEYVDPAQLGPTPATATTPKSTASSGLDNRSLGFERFDAVRDQRLPLDLRDTRLGDLHFALLVLGMLAEPQRDFPKHGMQLGRSDQM
jgi:hypothetical protein